jgi:hypothetical protein
MPERREGGGRILQWRRFEDAPFGDIGGSSSLAFDLATVRSFEFKLVFEFVTLGSPVHSSTTNKPVWGCRLKT